MQTILAVVFGVAGLWTAYGSIPPFNSGRAWVATLLLAAALRFAREIDS